MKYVLKCHTAFWLLGWEKGQPLIRQLQCEKQRSVCTISSMSVDEEGICVGLGSSGDLEFWNRRTNERVWRYREQGRRKYL